MDWLTPSKRTLNLYVCRATKRRKKRMEDYALRGSIRGLNAVVRFKRATIVRETTGKRTARGITHRPEENYNADSEILIQSSI